MQFQASTGQISGTYDKGFNYTQTEDSPLQESTQQLSRMRDEDHKCRGFAVLKV